MHIVCVQIHIAHEEIPLPFSAILSLVAVLCSGTPARTMTLSNMQNDFGEKACSVGVLGVLCQQAGPCLGPKGSSDCTCPQIKLYFYCTLVCFPWVTLRNENRVGFSEEGQPMELWADREAREDQCPLGEEIQRRTPRREYPWEREMHREGEGVRSRVGSTEGEELTSR